MFRKLASVLPIAILLGAVSAAPTLAQTPSHDEAVSPSAFGGDSYDSSALHPGQDERPSQGEAPAVSLPQDPEVPQDERRSLGETPAIPWTQAPDPRA
jgi:hypothetical protein